MLLNRLNSPAEEYHYYTGCFKSLHTFPARVYLILHPGTLQNLSPSDFKDIKKLNITEALCFFLFSRQNVQIATLRFSSFCIFSCFQQFEKIQRENSN